MNWEIPDAQQRFSELLDATTQEPQFIYKLERPIAVLVDAESFQEFLAWRKQHQTSSLADAFVQLRQLCLEEDYILETPPRQNRSNPFADGLENVSV